MSTLDTFIADTNGQSLSFDGLPVNRGQCVQSVSVYVHNYLHLPVIWADAAYWWYNFNLPSSYDQIANTPTAIPQEGDIIIWDKTLPNSGGAGHIAICKTSRPGTGTFISYDSNWAGKYSHLVTHNYDYVIGWLRPKVAANTPPVTQGLEMITTNDDAIKLYKMLRPNGVPSDSEVAATVNRRSYAQFVSDAQQEVTQRDQNLLVQNKQLASLQAVIDQLNQTVTNLKITDAATLKQYQDQVAQLTAQLTTEHDKLAALQAQDTSIVTGPQTPKTNIIVTLLALLTKKKQP